MRKEWKTFLAGPKALRRAGCKVPPPICPRSAPTQGPISFPPALLSPPPHTLPLPLRPPSPPQIYTNALQCLSEEDRQLRPISRMLPLLKRGIGVHHSGGAGGGGEGGGGSTGLGARRIACEV